MNRPSTAADLGTAVTGDDTPGHAAGAAADAAFAAGGQFSAIPANQGSQRIDLPHGAAPPLSGTLRRSSPPRRHSPPVPPSDPDASDPDASDPNASDRDASDRIPTDRVGGDWATGDCENGDRVVDPADGLADAFDRDDWLRLHAADLIARLQSWSDQLDRREAGLNARSAAQDQRERQFRLQRQMSLVDLQQRETALQRLESAGEIAARVRRRAFESR